MSTALIITALHYGADLVVPFALAVLVSFLLSYPVTLLERLRIGHAGSVIVVMLVAFSAAGIMIWVATSELTQIAVRLPEYQQNIRAKLDRIQHLDGGNGRGAAISEAARNITQLADDLGQANQTAQQAAGPSKGHGKAQAAQQPIPVQVVHQPTGVFGTLGIVGAPIGRFFATVAAVIILTLFMLLNRGSLRNRLFRLFGRGRITVMTTAMDDAAQRVSRYLITQGLVNTAYGSLLGVGLYFIGVPYAPFWGCAAIFLRFIPYLGTFVAGMSPFVLSLAVFEGWKMPLLTLGLFVAVEGMISGFIEPWLYATRTGISSLAILLSATFWTLLWGPIGLVMATPLTVLLVVLGRHVPQFEFLYVLLGDEPVLAPEAHYYQRLLALDEDEAHEVAEEFLNGKQIQELYDAVLIPALALAEEDRHENQLDEQREKFIYQTTRYLIEELGERADQQLPETGSDSQPADSQPAIDGSILCIPARDEADELVALMLCQSLKEKGYQAESIPIGFVEQMLSKVKAGQPDVLFISALPPFAVTHARSLCRRARQVCTKVKVVIGLWGAGPNREALQERLGPGCSDYLVHSISEAELQLRLFAGSAGEHDDANASETSEIENPDTATQPVLTESTK
ncbi:MAG TPA: AI-2E family transporter [Bryobacteraceae bacterium]|nr:AI-2E family transporter [Bryobacteraceae bacterium]